MVFSIRPARINKEGNPRSAYCFCISTNKFVFPLPASAASTKILARAPIHSRSLISISSRRTYTPGINFFSVIRVSRMSLFSSATRTKNTSFVKTSGVNGCSFCLSRKSIFNRSNILPEVCFSVPSGLKNFMVLPVYDSYVRICSLSSLAIAISPGTTKKGIISIIFPAEFSIHTWLCLAFGFSHGCNLSLCKR